MSRVQVMVYVSDSQENSSSERIPQVQRKGIRVHNINTRVSVVNTLGAFGFRILALSLILRGWKIPDHTNVIPEMLDVFEFPRIIS